MIEIIEGKMEEKIQNFYGQKIILTNSVKTKEDLFRAYFDQTGAMYMGRTWDSLDEVLIDCDWMTSDSISVIHENLPNLDELDLKMYFQTLKDAQDMHEKGPEYRVAQPQRKIHFRVVIFVSNENERKRAQDLIEGIA